MPVLLYDQARLEEALQLISGQVQARQGQQVSIKASRVNQSNDRRAACLILFVFLEIRLPIGQKRRRPWDERGSRVPLQHVLHQCVRYDL